MAVDTVAKRLSMMDMGEGLAPGIPIPNGSFSAADRFHLLWLYSGFGTVDTGGGVARQRGFILNMGRMMQ